MYSYTQETSFEVDHIYECNILDPEGNRICTIFDDEEGAKLLLKHLNKEKEEKNEKC